MGGYPDSNGELADPQTATLPLSYTIQNYNNNNYILLLL